LSELEGSFSLEMRAGRIEDLKREYDGIVEAVPDFKQFTHDEFVWARLVVITRQFGITVDGHETDGRVPYADMLNHKIPRATEWTYTDSKKGFPITALKGLARGEEVFDSYGRKCNSRFFVNYGFALDENESDNEAVIRLALDHTDAAFSVKLRLLGNSMQATRQRFQIPADSENKKTKKMFSFLRFMFAKDKELIDLQQVNDIEDLKIDPRSVRNELEVLIELRRGAAESLAKFKTTIDEDEKLKKEKPMYSNIRNAIVMRLGEKRVLQWFIDLADTAIPMLKMPWKDLKRQAGKSRQTSFDKYISTVVVQLVKNQNKNN